jgi:CBS domain containing-hemolysin-like protein
VLRRRHRPSERRPPHPAGRGDAGLAEDQERLILSALEDLRDTSVREVMTPRVDVEGLSIPVHAADVARAVRTTGHSCFPVYDDDLDHLIGVLFVNDLFRTGWEIDGRNGADGGAPSPLDISRRLRQPYLVPESRLVLDVLSDMRRDRRAFAVVVDEYGGVAGVLTVKDLIEPLVGQLSDEFDDDEEPEIVRVDVNRWLIDGRTSVDEVHERLGIDLPEGEYVTIGGYLFDGFGHIPTEGEQLTVDGWELRVVELEKRRIAKVLARREPPTQEAPPPSDQSEEQTPRKEAAQSAPTTAGAGPLAQVATQERRGTLD